ncbi:MAG: hypothetical protein K0R25_590 [Rickettsiaceae bacterium]|jgi:SAM-dependent MidA family methyltransferase|nr:hypothetical protein [Rickettsiaceae bacterium]
MNEALFHPELGYYKCKDPFGKAGDFTTAPEISQVFGELIGAYLINLWQNNYAGKKINLVEMGAGRGTLMKDLLNFAKKIPGFLEQSNLAIIETSPKLQKIQQQNLQEFNISWYENFSDFYQQNNQAPIFFISNELFDCFAINQFIKTENGWVERMVAVGNDGELQFVLRPSAKPSELQIAEVKIDAVFEQSPQALAFMTELSEAIKKTGGIGLIIDYGYVENEMRNTLQAVSNHQYCDILKEVGESDLTALVDFSSLQKTALQNNLKTSIVSQREFLIALGIEARRENLLIGKNDEKRSLINSAIDRLIDKEQMGELFKVLIIW